MEMEISCIGSGYLQVDWSIPLTLGIDIILLVTFFALTMGIDQSNNGCHFYYLIGPLSTVQYFKCRPSAMFLYCVYLKWIRYVFSFLFFFLTGYRGRLYDTCSTLHKCTTAMSRICRIIPPKVPFSFPDGDLRSISIWLVQIHFFLVGPFLFMYSFILIRNM